MDLSHAACYRALSARDARFDGRLFVGVHTTGIYCRPICPARTPRPEHVSFYATAAAAQEAGFRPCLRCRPERSPELAAWRGTSNSVSRALALISEGGLDGERVGTLAERLGVGERQLRRLFKQHLGASPVSVAQTRRVLFARQLITETRMPMSEIAMAAGFSSIRRFNATLQALYGKPPRQLRRTGGSDVSGESSGITLVLPYARPYDWDAIIGFLAAHAIPGLERVDALGRYHRTIALEHTKGVVSIEHDDRAGSIRSTIRFPRVRALSSIVARLRRMFDLAADPGTVDSHLSADALLARLIAKRPGLRVPSGWDGFETAVCTILRRHFIRSRASDLAGRLVVTYGEPVPMGAAFGLSHTFPTPEVLIEADLSRLGIPASPAETLSGLAKAVVRNPDLFRPSQSLEGIIEQLRAVPHMDAATAQYIAMRALQEPDAFPTSDMDLGQAIADATGLCLSATDLLARAETWRPWRAYAALHLWTSQVDWIRMQGGRAQPGHEDGADATITAVQSSGSQHCHEPHQGHASRA